ncbi:MAG: hypothetical protein M1305_02760, partial [Candidatus Marsarchaeota archaeon]|nr:hypothetical protein [Candidatus Marsarchaeota archaeon]
AMREFIASEKARLQVIFDEFNRDGSIMEMREGRDTPLPFGLIDSYTITRVAPHFDAAGNVTKTDYWVMFKSVGYDNGYQYTHTIKVVGWGREDTYELDLTDDRGRHYHIELIMDVTEHYYVLDWRKWQSYKAENAAEFGIVDAQLLGEHTTIAEGWE